MTDQRPHRLLDLDLGVGQVAARWEFDIVNRALEVQGSIHPRHDQSTITIDNNTRSRIPRTAQGVVVREQDWRNLNILSDHLAVSMRLEDGTRWPLGVFLIGDDHEKPHSQESANEMDLADFTTELDDALPESVSIEPGGEVRPVLVLLAEQALIYKMDIAPSSFATGQALNFPVGASRLDVMTKLAGYMGMLPPYFDNSGRLIVRRAPALFDDDGHSNALLHYNLDRSRIIPDSSIINRNVTKAPNAYLVIGNGGGSAPVSAIAYIDPDSPNSSRNRGRTITKPITDQGVATVEQAQALANQRAQTDIRQFATASFTGPPDPRHDTYDVIEFLDEVWLETAWSMACTPGGAHTHSIVKTLDTEPGAD